MLYGALWIVGLVAFAAAIFVIDRLPELGRGTFHVVAVFPHVNKLRAESEVWVAGYPVGRVHRIGFVPAGTDTTERLAVVLRLPNSVRPMLRRDTRPVLRTPAFLGDQVVDLVPGSSRAPPLEEGDTLYGDAQIRFPQIIARVANLRRSADALLQDVVALERATDAGNADEGFARVSRSLRGVRQELDVLAAGAEDGSLRLLLEDAHAREALGRVQRSVGALGELTRRRRASVPHAAWRRFEAHATQLGAQLAQLQALADSTGFIGRMSADSALLAAVHATQAQLDSLIAEAKKRPWRFVF